MPGVIALLHREIDLDIDGEASRGDVDVEGVVGVAGEAGDPGQDADVVGVGVGRRTEGEAPQGLARDPQVHDDVATADVGCEFHDGQARGRLVDPEGVVGDERRGDPLVHSGVKQARRARLEDEMLDEALRAEAPPPDRERGDASIDRRVEQLPAVHAAHLGVKDAQDGTLPVDMGLAKDPLRRDGARGPLQSAGGLFGHLEVLAHLGPVALTLDALDLDVHSDISQSRAERNRARANERPGNCGAGAAPTALAGGAFMVTSVTGPTLVGAGASPVAAAAGALMVTSAMAAHPRSAWRGRPPPVR